MNRIIAILGPTASGKTELSINIAERLSGEIVSVDSMQVYRGMDIGTAKPTLSERRGITHHLLDIAHPEEDFSVARFATEGRQIIAGADSPLVISGGSGLHFRSLVDPMSFAPTDPVVRAGLETEDPSAIVARLLAVDPAAAENVDLANPRRVTRAMEIYELTGETPGVRAARPEADDLRRYVAHVPFTAIGVDPGELTDERIDERLEAMRQEGLVDEVNRLWRRMGRTARTAVGYREIAEHVEGHVGTEAAFADAARSTKRLARKQRTWFRRDPRIHWIPWVDTAEGRTARVMELIG